MGLVVRVKGLGFGLRGFFEKGARGLGFWVLGLGFRLGCVVALVGPRCSCRLRDWMCSG